MQTILAPRMMSLMSDGTWQQSTRLIYPDSWIEVCATAAIRGKVIPDLADDQSFDAKIANSIMPTIQWDEKYRTGNATVDEQHMELFRMVNSLHDAIVTGKGKEFVYPILDKLANYVGTHFKNEEELMQQTHYEEYVAHKRLHEDLAQRATDVIQKYRGGKIMLSMTLSTFLADWLKNHINAEDMKMIQWVKEHGK